MKFNKDNISINDILNRNSVFKLIIHFLLSLLFLFVRCIAKLFPYDGNNIIIISLHRLGDTIFTIPAINQVYKKFGNKTIICCLPESIPIYRMIFGNITIIDVKHDDFYFGKRIAKSRIRGKLKSFKPSIVIDLTGSMISASLIFNLRSNQIIGINAEQFANIYDHFVKFRHLPQLKDIYLDAITSLLQNVDRKDIINENVSINAEGKILIHPFAGWFEKEWSKKKFIELAGLLNQKYNVGIITQKGQLDWDVITEISSKKIDILQTEFVDELIENIKCASIFIGNDSGPVNIANFLGKPTFTIFGATNPDYVKSNLPHQICFQKNLKCSARNEEKFCLIGGMIYNCSGIQCMNLLTVKEVITALEPLLNSYCKKKKSVD